VTPALWFQGLIYTTAVAAGIFALAILLRIAWEGLQATPDPFLDHHPSDASDLAWWDRVGRDESIFSDSE
jgi:hypothetical protein